MCNNLFCHNNCTSYSHKLLIVFVLKSPSERTSNFWFKVPFLETSIFGVFCGRLFNYKFHEHIFYLEIRRLLPLLRKWIYILVNLTVLPTLHCAFHFVPNFKLQSSFIERDIYFRERERQIYGIWEGVSSMFIFLYSDTEKYNIKLLGIIPGQGMCILILVESAFYFITSSYFGSWFGKRLRFKTHIRQMLTILLSRQLNMCS